MGKLSAERRQEEIMELLSKNGSIKTIDLADYFQVSRETIRRDLNSLNEEGKIQKGFGGAIAPINDFSVLPVETRVQSDAYEKQILCEKVMEYIPDHSVIFIDSGSTTAIFANLLKDKSGYTIITGSIPVINTLAGSNNTVIATGGTVNASVGAFYGMQATSFLKTIRIDVAILGTSGFERHTGPSTNHFEDAEIKQRAIAAAQTSIVVTSSKKASYSSMVQYADWDEIDYLITNASISRAALERLSDVTTVITV